MAIFIWLVLGILVGVLGRAPIKRSAIDLLGDIAIGIVGAILGAWLSNRPYAIGTSPVTVRGVLLAVLGAIVLLGLYHLTVRDRIRWNR